MAQRNSQFEAWDMLSGPRRARNWAAPEQYLDIVGVNFYSANEWEVPGRTQAALGRGIGRSALDAAATSCWRKCPRATSARY